MNKKILYIALAIVIIAVVIFALTFLLMPRGNKDYKIVSIKNAGGEQITLVGKTVNVIINLPSGKKVNVDKIIITAKQGLTKVSGLFLPTGVTKSVQVIMPAGKTQICVSDTDNAELSPTCNGLNETIVSCPGSKQGFTCEKISDTLFEVSGLNHSILGDFVDCSGHGTRASSGACSCTEGYYGTACDTKGCKADADCDAGYTCDTTKGFCKEKTCSTSCTYANGTGVCDKGTCKLSNCLTSWANCDSNSTNGCETNLLSTVNNCGFCGTVCTAGKVCSSGYCIDTAKGNGLACTQNSDCISSHCLQTQSGKLCAAVASCSSCKVINIIGTECVNALDSTDPKSDCTSGNTCISGTCSATPKALGSACSINNDCTSLHCVQSQSGKICSSVSSCSTCQVVNSAGTSCINATDSTDPKSDCTSGHACTSGACAATTKALGAECSINGDCTSGHCVQGQSAKRCSSASSCPACQVINAAGTDCISASASTDPKDECSTGSILTCGNNGFCDGSGACAKYPVGTVCSNPICSNNSYTAQSTCNSSATCIVPSPIPCDDSNSCTTDNCNTSNGCTHTTISCDDSNECTTDSCDTDSGCIHTNNTSSCSNNTGTCADGACVPNPE